MPGALYVEWLPFAVGFILPTVAIVFWFAWWVRKLKREDELERMEERERPVNEAIAAYVVGSATLEELDNALTKALELEEGRP